MAEAVVGMSVREVILAIFFFTLITLLVSYFVSKARMVTNLEDYLVSGRRLPWPLVTVLLVSGWIYTSSTLGAAESSLSFGASGLWMYSMYGLSLLAVGLVIPYFKERIADKLGIDSITDFIRYRFDAKTYWIFLVIIWSGSYLTTLVNISGAGYVISGLTLGAVPSWIGVVSLSVVTLFYVIVGGFWSTALTAWVLTLVISLGVVSSVPYIMAGAGGAPMVLQAAHQVSQSMGKPELINLWNPYGAKVFLLASVLMFFSGLAMQEWYQPGIASTGRKLRAGYFLAFVWVLLITSVSGGLGFVGFSLVNSGQIAAPPTPSEVYPYLVALFAPRWVGFLMLFLVFGAGSGTVAVTTMAQSTILKGGYKQWCASKNKEIASEMVIWKGLRYYTVVAVIVGAFLAIVFRPSILFLLVLACAVYAPLGIPILLAMFWSKVNKNGVFWGALVGEIATLYLFFAESPGVATLVGMAIGAILTVIFTLVKPLKSEIKESY